MKQQATQALPPLKLRVLVADDDPMMRAILQSQIEKLGHRAILATDGTQAMDLLQGREQVDLALLDREMPGAGGLDIVRMMKADSTLRGVPVVMVTAADRPEDIREGIDAGVFYYLTKPLEAGILTSVLSAAMRDIEQRKTLSGELGEIHHTLGLLDHAGFSFRTLTEAEHLAALVAYAFPEPDRVLVGLAELMINAIEHGNLGLNYEDKSMLLASAGWRTEVTRRQLLPEHKNKTAKIVFAREQNRYIVRISDEGKGFDWKRYLFLDPSRASDSHGRGIAQANAFSFDALSYNEAGTEVTAIVNQRQELDW